MVLYKLALCLLLLLAASVSSQRMFLEQFFVATGGRSWNQNAVWLLENVSSCLWFGISCDGQGNITGISLPKNNLQGNIESIDFGAVPLLTTIDLGSNRLEGRVPTSLFYLPSISSISLQDNRFTKLEFSALQQRQLAIASSLRSVRLSGNRFFCPYSAYVRTFVLPLTIDATSARCIRTMTLSRHVSPTILLEPPVGIPISSYSGDVAYILLSTTTFNATSPFYVNLVAVVLYSILNRTVLQEQTLPVLSANVSASNEFFSVAPAVWNGGKFVNISFGASSAASADEKWSIVARLQSTHVSVASLSPSQVITVKVGGTLPPMPAPLAPPTVSGGITTTSEILFICIAAAVLVVLVVGAICIRLLTRHPFNDIVQPKIQVIP